MTPGRTYLGKIGGELRRGICARDSSGAEPRDGCGGCFWAASSGRAAWYCDESASAWRLVGFQDARLDRVARHRHQAAGMPHLDEAALGGEHLDVGAFRQIEPRL